MKGRMLKASLLISAGGGLVGVATGMALETGNGGAYNATPEYLTVVSIDWSHVGTPLTIAVWLLIVTIAKMGLTHQISIQTFV